jgi:flagellar motor switch protein FliM
MSWLIKARRGLDAAVLVTARGSQAAVIEVVDRLVGGQGARHDGARRSSLGRLFNFQLDVMDRLVGDAASVTDQSFDGTIRLFSLHREFLQRVFEAMDTRDATPVIADSELVAPVVHLDVSGARRR